MIKATATFVAFVAAGTLLALDAIRPGVGVGAIILGVALFAAGGVDPRYRLAWVPFVAVGVLLAALNFTPLALPREATSIALGIGAIAALLVGAGRARLRSLVARN